jgi:putative transposase
MNLEELGRHPASLRFSKLAAIVLSIASPTFLSWVTRHADPSWRKRDNRTIIAEIADIHAASGGTYEPTNAPSAAPSRRPGLSSKRVERLMFQADLQGTYTYWSAPREGRTRT